MDLTDRKKRILKAVVEDYIRTAEPVGSKAIAQEMGPLDDFHVNFSSLYTIFHIM